MDLFQDEGPVPGPAPAPDQRQPTEGGLDIFNVAPPVVTEAPQEEGTFERAHRAGWEALKSAVSPFLPGEKRPEEYKGVSGALHSLGETGRGILGAVGAPFAYPAGAAASLGATALAPALRGIEKYIAAGTETVSPETAERMRSNIPTEPQAYEALLPGMEAAVGAVGAKRLPTGAPAIRPEAFRPGKGPDAQAGQILEKSATDPEALRATLENPSPQKVPGSEPTTYQLTGDPRLGQLERAAQIKSQDEFGMRRAEQNSARLEALDNIQKEGSPEAVGDHLRTMLREAEGESAQATKLAEMRAWQEAHRLGGQNDPEIYGNILRHELQISETATRAREGEIWRRVDPEGKLLASAMPLQELERSIYGRMTQAAEASRTPAEHQIADLIQNYRPVVPFKEMTDLRSFVSSAMREERMQRGLTPAYARLVQLRTGIEDRIVNNVVDVETGRVVKDAAQRVQEASAATRQRAQTFNVSPLREIMRREGLEGPYRMQTGAVPGAIITPGPRGYENASAFLRAVGNREGVPVLQDSIVAQMRRKAMSPDGTINPKNLQRWMDQHQDVLRAMDERDGGAFSQRLRSAGQAAEMVGEIAARRAAIEEEVQRGVLGKLIGATDPDDISNIIGRTLSGDTAVQNSRALASRLTTPEARAGAARAIMDFIRDKFISNTEAGNTEKNIIRADQFQTFVKKSRAALAQFLSPEQISNLEAIAADIKQSNRSIQTKMPGGSNTPQDLFLMRDQESSILSKLFAHGLMAKIPGSQFFVGAQRMVRDAGIRKIQDIVTRAMLDPALARDLLRKAKGTSYLPSLKRWVMYEAATHREKESERGFEKGGRVEKSFTFSNKT